MKKIVSIFVISALFLSINANAQQSPKQKKQKAKTDGFEVIILSDLVASNDEDNTFSLLVSPRLRFNFAKILKISSPFPTLLAQNLEVNLNNFSIELNFGIRF